MHTTRLSETQAVETLQTNRLSETHESRETSSLVEKNHIDGVEEVKDKDP